MPSAITNTTYNLGSVSLLEEVAHVDNVNNSFNTTGKYAIYLPYATYLDRSSLYMKHGDTVSVSIVNPSGGAIGFVAGDTSTTARQAYPAPSSYSASTSGSTFSLTWPSSLADSNFQTSGNNVSFANDTQWPFIGYPYISDGSGAGSNISGGGTRSGYKYSRKIRTSIVTGQIGLATGETQTITEGHSSISIYSGSTITGLNKVSHSVPASGGVNLNNPSYYTSFSNKLYVSLWNSTGTAKFTNSTVSGKWGVGSAWLGFLSEAYPTVTLNTASLVAGTYRIYLNHYSGGASPSPPDRRTATDSRLYYVTLIVKDNKPTPSSFDFTDLVGEPVNTLKESNVMTPSGYDIAAAVSVSSGDERAFRVAGGTWYAGGTSGQTISPGQTLQLRVKSHPSASTSRNVFVSIGFGNNSTSPWTVTTGAAASDISPDAFSFINVAGVVSQAETSNSVTLQGYDANTTITALATGTTVSINGGTFTNVIGTSVPTSASVRIQITPGSSFSTPYTGFVKIGATQSTTWTVTTGADTSGTAVAPVTGNATYGIEILNNSSNVIFSPDFRNTSFVKLGNGAAVGTTSIAQGATRTITGIEGALANNSTDIIISLRVTSTSSYKEHKLSVLRTNGGFTITNNGVTGTPSAGSRSVEYMVMRV